MPAPLEIDTQTYIAAIKSQRDTAFEQVAQLEGIITVLKNKLAALEEANGKTEHGATRTAPV